MRQLWLVWEVFGLPVQVQGLYRGNQPAGSDSQGHGERIGNDEGRSRGLTGQPGRYTGQPGSVTPSSSSLTPPSPWVQQLGSHLVVHDAHGYPIWDRVTPTGSVLFCPPSQSSLLTASI